MEGWIAVTHSDWFDFLAQQWRREEVNFWSPSDHYAFHGTPGAPFFFKLKAPRNAIGGFGFVASFSRLPEWLAWECFGEGNGARSLERTQSQEPRRNGSASVRSGSADFGEASASPAVARTIEYERRSGVPAPLQKRLRHMTSACVRRSSRPNVHEWRTRRPR